MLVSREIITNARGRGLKEAGVAQKAIGLMPPLIKFNQSLTIKVFRTCHSDVKKLPHNWFPF